MVIRAASFFLPAAALFLGDFFSTAVLFLEGFFLPTAVLFLDGFFPPTVVFFLDSFFFVLLFLESFFFEAAMLFSSSNRSTWYLAGTSDPITNHGKMDRFSALAGNTPSAGFSRCTAGRECDLQAVHRSRPPPPAQKDPRARARARSEPEPPPFRSAFAGRRLLPAGIARRR